MPSPHTDHTRSLHSHTSHTLLFTCIRITSTFIKDCHAQRHTVLPRTHTIQIVKSVCMHMNAERTCGPLAVQLPEHQQQLAGINGQLLAAIDIPVMECGRVKLSAGLTSAAQSMGKIPTGSVWIYSIFNVVTQIPKERGCGVAVLALETSFLWLKGAHIPMGTRHSTANRC